MSHIRVLIISPIIIFPADYLGVYLAFSNNNTFTNNIELYIRTYGMDFGITGMYNVVFDNNFPRAPTGFGWDRMRNIIWCGIITWSIIPNIKPMIAVLQATRGIMISQEIFIVIIRSKTPGPPTIGRVLERTIYN